MFFPQKNSFRKFLFPNLLKVNKKQIAISPQTNTFGAIENPLLKFAL